MNLVRIYFDIVPLIVAMAVMLIGAIVYTGDRRNPVGASWFLACIFGSLWSLLFFLVINSSSEYFSSVLRIFLDSSAILVMFFWLRFVIIFLNINNKTIHLLAIVSTCLMLVLNLVPGFVKGMVPKYIFNYYVEAGWGYYVFILYFIGISMLGMVLLYLHTRHVSDLSRLKQIRNIFRGSLVGLVGGGSSFLLSFNIPIPPYLFILFAMLPLIIAIGIVRYRLFNIKTVTTELFILAIWIFVTIRLVFSTTSEDLIINGILLIAVIVFGLLMIRSMYNEIQQRLRIQTLADDLEKTNTRLIELNRQKSEFVSFATHQLRGPLTAMKGYASLLLEGDMGKLPASAKKGVARIYDSTNTLVSIVNDYLNISRIELGAMKYAFETLDLRGLIEDVIAELKPNIDKTGVKFSFEIENRDVDYRTTADRDKMKQVIANVIDNSLKYTPSGSIDARLSFDRTKHVLVFKIKDTGVGIAPEVLPRLFQKFSRAENANKTNIRGTGLGLYVAKEIVLAHHGSIRAESPGEGKGATFIVELEPFAKA